MNFKIKFLVILLKLDYLDNILFYIELDLSWYIKVYCFDSLWFC